MLTSQRARFKLYSLKLKVDSMLVHLGRNGADLNFGKLKDIPNSTNFLIQSKTIPEIYPEVPYEKKK